MTVPKWLPGQYAPEDLHARINALLALAQDRAKADRKAGRVKAAEDGDELVICVTEHIRWSVSTILSLEHAILMQHACQVAS